MTFEIITSTNQNHGSIYSKRTDCILFWEREQQWAYARLSDKAPKNNEYEILGGYAQRAERIAATYARFYLETEDFGTPSKKGRYYWMGLAAFAVKTVLHLFVDSRTFTSPSSRKILAKGNFWLFMDIAPWHLAYSLSPESFKMCRDIRDTGSFQTPQVVEAMGNVPFSAAVHQINHLKSNAEIREGFELVEQIEKAPAGNKERPKKQFRHLMVIAQHEQLRILQTLCWNEPDLRAASARQRSLSWISPVTEITFTHKRGTAHIKDEAFKKEITSTAPDGTIVEDYPSRMAWIGEAAKKYHYLMYAHTSYMERELRAIAGWL